MVTVNRNYVSKAFEAIPPLEEVGKGIDIALEGLSEQEVIELRLFFLRVSVGQSPPLLAGKMAVMAAQCISSVFHHFLDGKEIASGNNN